MPKPTPELAAAIRAFAEVGPARRGSIGQRTMKCGKPTCPCQTDPAARHGPYTELQRIVGGRRKARDLSPAQAEVAFAQIRGAEVFRERIETLWEASERWADAEVEAIGALEMEAPKKRGSKPRS